MPPLTKNEPIFRQSDTIHITGGPPLRRPPVMRISLQDGFSLLSKFTNSSHKMDILFTIPLRQSVKKILPFFRLRGGPSVHQY